MFSLIITIISIALVAALAIASIYYGGDAFSQGSAKAAASTVVSQAQQVSAANTLYKNDNAGSNSADVATLVTDKYLQSAPNLPTNIGATDSWTLDGSSVTHAVANEEICSTINNQIGADNTTLIAASGATTFPTTGDIGTQYGCAETAEATYTFLYK